MKQNKDVVWSLVLLLIAGVRADPKYSYSYDIICMDERIVTFDFSLKFLFTGRKTVRKISVPTLILYEIHHIDFTHACMVTSRSPSV